MFSPRFYSTVLIWNEPKTTFRSQILVSVVEYSNQRKKNTEQNKSHALHKTNRFVRVPNN